MRVCENTTPQQSQGCSLRLSPVPVSVSLLSSHNFFLLLFHRNASYTRGSCVEWEKSSTTSAFAPNFWILLRSHLWLIIPFADTRSGIQELWHNAAAARRGQRAAPVKVRQNPCFHSEIVCAIQFHARLPFRQPCWHATLELRVAFLAATTFTDSLGFRCWLNLTLALFISLWQVSFNCVMKKRIALLLTFWCWILVYYSCFTQVVFNVHTTHNSISLIDFILNHNWKCQLNFCVTWLCVDMLRNIELTRLNLKLIHLTFIIQIFVAIFWFGNRKTLLTHSFDSPLIS